MLIFSCLSPHPPIIIPEIGKDELKKVKKTCQALELLNKKFVQAKPETVILISPHAPLLSEYFAISSTNIFSGDFQQFGDFKNYFEFKNDYDIENLISQQAKEKNIPTQLIAQSQLDHGALVPLYYLTRNYKDIKLVLLSLSLLDFKTHFKFGQLLQNIIKNTKKRIAVVASGDLSHRLTPSAPAGFHPDGKKFDAKLITLLKERKIKEILNLELQFVENAGECGLRSIIILLGILDKFDYNVKILSYEGPFGVGYLVAEFEI